MIPTTQDWKDYSVDFSNYQPYILVTKNADVVWSFTVDNIKEGSLRFTDDVSSLGGFNIGATPSNHFECDIINFDQSFPSPEVFEGCKARLYFFLSATPTLGGTNAVVGQAIVGQAVVNTVSSWSNDYICRGHYYLDPITSVGSTVHLSGSDEMSLEEFNSSNIDGYHFGGKTCMQVVRELGFNIQTTFPNYDYILPDVIADETHNMSGISRRTILSHIASMCGCYARYSNEGQLELRALGDDLTVTTLTKIMEEPDVDYYPIEITGAYVTGTKDVEAVVGGSGYYLFVENNPLITTNAEATTIATDIATLYSGFQLTPFQADIIADPSLEAGDLVEFDVNGNTVQSIVTSISYHDGGITQISAEADSDTHASAEAATSSVGYVKRSINELYSGDTLKEIINYSGSQIKIKADSIDLTGAVFVDGTINCNDTFTVDSAGNVVANSLSSSDMTVTGGVLSVEAPTVTAEQVKVTCGVNITAMTGYGLIVYDGTNYQNQVAVRPGLIWLAKNGSSQPGFFVETDQSTGNATLNMMDRITMLSGTGKITCVSLTQTSDKKSKEEIEALDKAKSTKFIYKLKPVSFKYKGLDEVHHGFIAQDVEKISDWDLVTESNGKKALSYIDIIADLVATVQTLNERVAELEKKNGIK